MQQHSGRLRWAGLPVALRVVGVGVFCVAALSFLAFHPTPHASAAGLARNITGTIASSPSAGPVGTTISVSGSGWGGSDGTPVSFGYQVLSGCQIVSDAQDGSLIGGAFSGWFRWPAGTPLNTYRVCAMIGNVMAVAGSFSVLSSSPPAVSISPSTLAPGTQATITASNYYPAGTSVNFFWMWGNTLIENLNSVASDTSGNAVLTFTVPGLSIASGLYSIDASTGNRQPATLFSSTDFTYSAPVVSPSPTPRPSPSPSPTKTPGVTPTATRTPVATPTTKASATPTAKSPTAGASPTAANSQTPAANSTNSGNNGTINTDATAASVPNNPLLVAGIIVLSGALLIGLIALLLMSRRRKMARAGATVMPPGMPGGPGQVVSAPLVNTQGPPLFNGMLPVPLNAGLPLSGSMPGNGNPLSYSAYNPVSMSGVPLTPQTPAPVLVGAGIAAGNGNAAAPAANLAGPDAMPPVPPQLPEWLTNPSRGSAPPNMSVTSDPALEAIRRQAQSGLFVLPRPFKDERGQ